MRSILPTLPKLAPTPRRISRDLELQLIFGGLRSQLGYLFFGVGMFLLLLTLPRTDIASIWEFAGERDTVQGQVVETARTPDIPPRSRWPRLATVQAITYSFKATDGEDREATSWQWGGFRSPGDRITVQYLPDRPQVSRARGAWRDTFPPWLLLTAFLPVLGALLVVPRLKLGRLAIHLARHGEVCLAAFWSREDAFKLMGSAPIQHLQYKYRPDEAESDLFHDWRGSHPLVLADGPETPILYDPERPDQALLLLTLPAPFRLTPEGEFLPMRPERARLSVLPPVLATLALPAGALTWFL